MFIKLAVRELKENPECDKNNKAQNSVRDHEADGHIQSIIPDSFDDYESEIANAKLCLLPDTAIADQTCACSESCKSEMILDTEAEKSIYHLETTDSKPIIDCKTELVLNQEPHVGNDLDVKASLGFEFPSKMDTFGNMGDNSSHVEKQPADDDAKTFPDYSEGTNLITRTESPSVSSFMVTFFFQLAQINLTHIYYAFREMFIFYQRNSYHELGSMVICAAESPIMNSFDAAESKVYSMPL